MNVLLSRLLLAAASIASATGLVGLVSAPVAASTAPTLLHDARSITLNAPVPAVWAKLGQFDDLTWVPAVKTSTATHGNEIASKRSLDFGGATLTETLLAYNAGTHSYTYKIDDTDGNHKLAPVTDVVATISVRPAPAGGSVLTWTFDFRRLDWSETPTNDADDGAARKQIAATLAMGMTGAASKFPASN